MELSIHAWMRPHASCASLYKFADVERHMHACITYNCRPCMISMHAIWIDMGRTAFFLMIITKHGKIIQLLHAYVPPDLTPHMQCACAGSRRRPRPAGRNHLIFGFSKNHMKCFDHLLKKYFHNSISWVRPCIVIIHRISYLAASCGSASGMGTAALGLIPSNLRAAVAIGGH